MILALDIGTKTGWAKQVFPRDVISSGTLVLATTRELKEARQGGWDRKLDPRFSALLEFVTEELHGYSDKTVVFEDVQFSTYTAQTQLWASLRAAVWAAMRNQPLRIIPVPVGTLKKFATGHGAATKDMMLAALVRRFPALAKRKMDDNEVDARWLLLYANATLGFPT